MNTLVEVTRKDGDLFVHDFIGQIVGSHGPYITVQDQDGDCWDCELSQVKEVEHANA